MSYISPEIIQEVKKIDLLTYLQNYESDELVKYSRNTYCTKEHDSLKISNGKWMWFSQGIGGSTALEYLIKVKGMDFVEAAKTIAYKTKTYQPIYYSIETKQEKPLLLPEKSKTNDTARNYLLSRGIDEEIVDYCFENDLIMESLPYHNVIFIGYDEHQNAKYAAYRATNSTRLMGDCSGSKKEYSFRLLGTSDNEVHLFESAIDLFSYATLYKNNGGNYKDLNLISLAGVYAPKSNLSDSKIPITLKKFLENNPSINRIILHLDNDITGRKASKALKLILQKHLEVIDDPPQFGKDVNDFLCLKLKLKTNLERNYER